MTKAQPIGMPDTRPVWIANCPNCGPVRIQQLQEPYACKNKLRFGPRSIRQCRQILTNVRSTRG